MMHNGVLGEGESIFACYDCILLLMGLNECRKQKENGTQIVPYEYVPVLHESGPGLKMLS